MSMQPLREVIEGQVGTPPASGTTRLISIPASQGLTVSWPAILSVFIIGGIVAASPDATVDLGAACKAVRRLVLPHAGMRTPEPEHALVITADPKRRFNIVATLSPRGLEPLLAQTGDEIRSAIAAHPSGIRLVVLDGKLPQSAAMAALLRRDLPGGSLIVLPRSLDPAAIGATLIERL